MRALLPWNQHFFTSTRGRIVLLLRRTCCTVDELAQELGLTDNAIRAHLLTLERDGLVRQAGTRRGGGKPALIYALTAEAEQLFSRVSTPVLRELLAVLAEDMSAEQRAVIMQQVGQRLARQWSLAPGKLPTRLQSAVTLLNDLGGIAELEEGKEQYLIQGHHCPFAIIASTHPEVCKLAQTLLINLLGTSVTEQCEQNEPAHCRFLISKS